MATVEERLQQLENTSRTHHAMIDLLISIGERHGWLEDGDPED